jgi:hypothetical protein
MVARSVALSPAFVAFVIVAAFVFVVAIARTPVVVLASSGAASR